MIRGTDLEKALRDLRPIYAALMKAEADSKLDEVASNLNVRGAVDNAIASARADIATRARVLPMEFEALLAILGAQHTLAKKLKRKPSTGQIAKLIQGRVAGYADAIPVADEKAAIAAAAANDVRQRYDAWRAACRAVTGFPS